MNLLRSRDIIRGGCGKKLRRFWTICHVRCLQTEVSHKKNRSEGFGKIWSQSDGRIGV